MGLRVGAPSPGADYRLTPDLWSESRMRSEAPPAACTPLHLAALLAVITLGALACNAPPRIAVREPFEDEVDDIGEEPIKSAEGEGEGEGQGEGEGEGEGEEPGEGEGEGESNCPAGVRCIEVLPHVEDGTTADGASAWDGYGCGAQNESGPERVYRVRLPGPGTLRVVLDDTLEDSGVTDVDVQLLSSASPDACLARGDRAASVYLDAEFAWVALDSFVYLDGTVAAGAFTASFTFTPQGETPHIDVLTAVGVAPEVAALAARAYDRAREQGLTDSDTFSVIDFSLPSTERRLWIVDLAAGALLKNDRVSHGSGSNSGNNPAMAASFSNTSGSNQTSLGLSRFAETYEGSHGYSLRIDGLEDSNDNMRSRAIVMHGADYAEDEFVETHGYLGRSNGCPALAQSRSASTIDLVKEGTLLFSYFPDDDWLESSAFLQE